MLTGRRAIAALALLGLAPLVAHAILAVETAGRVLNTQAELGLETTSLVTSAAMDEELEGIGDLVASFARRPSLVAALDPADPDLGQIRLHLADLEAAHDGLDGVVLASAAGRVIDVFPETPAMVGGDASRQDWFVGGSSRASGAYVSDGFRSPLAGNPAVVAAAAPIRTPQGKLLGVLAATYGTAELANFVASIESIQGVALTVTDGTGQLLAAPGRTWDGESSLAEDPRIAAALAGARGILRVPSEEGDLITSYAPSRTGWAVVAEIPEKRARAALAPHAREIYGSAFLIGMVLIGLLAGLQVALTGRRRAAAELAAVRQTLEQVIDHASSAITVKDLDGRYILANRAFEELVGRSVARGASLAPADILPDGPVTEVADHDRQVLEEGRALQFEERLAGRDADRTFLSVRFPLMDPAGKPTAVAVIATEITDRKRTERELQAAHARALDASRHKSEFLANMSHEIRTPLNGVVGMAELLLGTNLDRQQRAWTETLRRSGDALLGVINDILDFSKIEAGRLEIEEIGFDVRTPFEDAVAPFAEAARAKGIELVLEIVPAGPLPALGDPGRLRQVVSNLVSNAIKFTHAGEVVVRAEVVPAPDGMRLRCTVRDTGIGIPSADQARLFEPFVQADSSTTRRFGGTGLGLSICRRLVALLGGEIGLESVPGAGTTLCFSVPLGCGAEGAERPAPAPPPPAARGARLLVVEDNPVNQLVATGILERLGHTVALAATGVEAVQRVAEGGYDAVLMDCQMPEMDGFEATRTIRRAELAAGRPRIPIVAMTAHALADDAEKCLAAGMDDYLTKPIRTDSLREALARVLEAPEIALDASVLSELAELRTPIGETLLSKLLSVFAEDTRGRLRALPSADHEGAARLLHALKGSAGNIGATSLAEGCAAWEAACAAGSSPAGAAAELAPLVERSLDAIRSRWLTT
jgi:PAS domain S-box-containing protein